MALSRPAIDRRSRRSPLFAFPPPSIRTLIERACLSLARLRPPNSWLDLEPLAAVLHPGVKRQRFDAWLADPLHTATRPQPTR